LFTSSDGGADLYAPTGYFFLYPSGTTQYPRPLLPRKAPGFSTSNLVAKGIPDGRNARDVVDCSSRSGDTSNSEEEDARLCRVNP